MTPEQAVAKVDKMIYMLAMRYMAFVNHGKLGLDDLVQAGRMGVIEAHARFKPEINSHFPTYAGWWIRAYIRKECYEQGRTVRVGVKYQTEAMKAGKPIAIGLSNIDDLTPFLQAPVPDEDHSKVFQPVVAHALGSLKPRHAEALRMRFFEDKTLKEIGDHFGVCRERARQICEEGLEQISDHIPAKMKEYL